MARWKGRESYILFEDMVDGATDALDTEDSSTV
jgi:hypothetical protein